MGLRLYWELCLRYGVKCADVYEEVLHQVRVSEDDSAEICCDRSIETTQKWNIIIQTLLWLISSLMHARTSASALA